MVLSLLVLSLQSQPSFAPNELVANLGFSRIVHNKWAYVAWENNGAFSTVASSLKSESNGSLLTSILNLQRRLTSNGLGHGSPGGYSTYKYTLPSLLPMGGEVKVRFTPDGPDRNKPDHGFALSCSGWYERLTLILDGPQTLEVSDIPVIERFARVFMARGAGQRLRNEHTTIIKGHSVKLRTCRFSGMSFVCLSDWSAAHEWQLTASPDGNSFALAKGSQRVVFPIAGMDVKVGGTWREMPDMVAEVGGTTFVPGPTLELLEP